jgi:hypothetical protein
MRSRSETLRRLCWQAARAVALYTAEGLTGYGLAMCAVPRSALLNGQLDGQIDPGELAVRAGLAACPDLAGLPGIARFPGLPVQPARPVTLSRRERRQWSRLARQLGVTTGAAGPVGTRPGL